MSAGGGGVGTSQHHGTEFLAEEVDFTAKRITSKLPRKYSEQEIFNYGKTKFGHSESTKATLPLPLT